MLGNNVAQFDHNFSSIVGGIVKYVDLKTKALGKSILKGAWTNNFYYNRFA